MWLPGELIARPNYTNALPGSLPSAMREAVERHRRQMGGRLGDPAPYGAGPGAGSGADYHMPQSPSPSPSLVTCKPPLVRDKTGTRCVCEWPNVQTPRGCRMPPGASPTPRPGLQPAPRPVPTPPPQQPPPAPGCPVCQVCPTCPPAADCPVCEGAGTCPDPQYIEVPGDCPAPGYIEVPGDCPVPEPSTGKLWFVALAGGVGALAVAFLAAKMSGG